MVIEPMVKPEGVLEGKRGVYIWVTDDERRIPVEEQTEVNVESVTAELYLLDLRVKLAGRAPACKMSSFRTGSNRVPLWRTLLFRR